MPSIPYITMYSQVFPSHPTSSPTPQTYILCPPFLPLLVQYAKPAPAPCYVSLLGQHCQQLEHITANCATCGPVKSRKREEEGMALCQWWGGRVPYSILDTATKHNVITNKRWFNRGSEYYWIDRLQMLSSLRWAWLYSVCFCFCLCVQTFMVKLLFGCKRMS